MTDLDERIEQADGPSRELDAEIVAYLTSTIAKPYPPAEDFGPSSKWQFWSRDGEHFIGNEDSPRFKKLRPAHTPAPELYEALASFEYQLGGETDAVKRRFADVRAKARAALWKAEGKQ